MIMHRQITDWHGQLEDVYSELSEAWLDGNRQAVEANKFFSLPVEPDAIVKVTPDLKKRPWMHRQALQH